MPAYALDDGFTMYARELGSGRPVVCLMGMGVSHIGWMLQLPVWAEHFRVIAPDNRGIGKTSCPPGPYETAQMARDVVALLDQAGVEEFDLVGISLGGMIAQQVALAAAGRVRRLVLVATTARPDASMRGEALEALQGLSKRPLVEVMQRLTELAFHRDWLAQHGEMLLTLFGQLGQFLPAREGLFSQLRAGAGHDCEDLLGALDLPVLVVHGDQDAMIPYSHGQRLAELLPRARLSSYANTGHSVNIERADRFNREVLDFLL